MPAVITSVAQANLRGIYIEYKASPTAATPNGTQRAAVVGLLPWGPLDTETAFTDPQTFRKTFCPDGFSRNAVELYLAATKFPWPDLQIVRILGATPVVATCQLQDSVPANSALVNAKYAGAQGSNITCTVATASDGVGTHRKLTFSITDSTTGANTTEVFDNVDFSKAIGDPSYTTTFASSLLVASITRQAGSTPAVGGPTSFTGGTDGAAVTAANYLGTPGAGDHGVAVLEKDPLVRFVFTDDPGSGILAAVNAGLKAHEILMTDRIALLTGLPAETDTTAKTNAALNVDTGCAYAFPHATLNDDNGTSRTIPSTGPLASLMTNMSPHLSPAYKNPDVTKILANITGLDYGTGSPALKDGCERGGVIVFEKNANGVFSPYDDVCTDGTPIYVKRMRDFIGFSLANALVNYQNGPNDQETFDEERGIVTSFLEQLKKNRSIDHIARTSILDYSVYPVQASNTTTDIQNGDFTIGFQVVLITAQKRIFLVGEIDRTVKINVSVAA